MAAREATVTWLMEGDPAIRWQCMRDLLQAPPEDVERERGRTATEGWGARLLSRQDPAGTWAGGLYTPKWTSTFYTLLLLRDIGLDREHAGAGLGARILLERGFCPADGGLNYTAKRMAPGESETCITGMGLAILSYFRVDDKRLALIAGHLLDHQMPDGGWNCRYPARATHASFNTTISALEGLLEWEQISGPSPNIEAARRRGEEFLLAHRLFRSHTTGAVAKPAFTMLSFPPRWHYDVLRGLDYFRAAGASRDKRLADGIELVRAKRLLTGLWPLKQRYAGATFFEMESLGKPSRWNTLRALRVIDWWEGG